MSAEPDWVTAIATIGATIVSVIAAFIAGKSASAAKSSADIATKALQRGAMKELLEECHSVIAEKQRIGSLIIDLRSEYKDGAVFAGQVGGSREKVLQANLDKDLENVSKQAKEAESLLIDQDSLIRSSTDDIDLRLGKIKADKVGLQTIRESMERDLDNVRKQNQYLREKR